jgi:hypothetical protein
VGYNKESYATRSLSYKHIPDYIRDCEAKSRYTFGLAYNKNHKNHQLLRHRPDSYKYRAYRPGVRSPADGRGEPAPERGAGRSGG